MTQKWLQLGQKIPLGHLFTTKMVSCHLVHTCCLILIFWNFHFSQKISFCQNQHSTDDFSVFFQYELYFLVPILTQKRLQLHRKMPLGPPSTTKLITLLLVNKRCLTLNFEYSTFPNKFIFGENQNSKLQTILVYFSSMNVGLWLPNWRKNYYLYLKSYKPIHGIYIYWM